MRPVCRREIPDARAVSAQVTRAGVPRQMSRIGTVRISVHGFRHGKCIGAVLKDARVIKPRHDLVPHRDADVAFNTLLVRRVVVARPDAAHRSRRVPHEQAIHASLRRASFARHLHAAGKAHLAARRALADHALHHFGHNGGVFARKHPLGRDCIAKQHRAVRVRDMEIGAPRHIIAVQKNGIGIGQLAQGHAVGKLPQRKPRLRHVRIGQRLHAQPITQKGERSFPAHVLQNLNRHRVDRLGKRGGYRGQSVIGIVCVTRPRGVAHEPERHVVVYACPVDDAALQRGCVDRERLDG